MLIDMNTDELQSAVQIARRANESISRAAELLNSVTIHNDWQCPERTEINENTTRNRSQALRLQADAENLFNNISYASQQFLTAEQEIARSFELVDGLVAGFLSHVPAGNMTAGKSGFASTADDILGSVGGAVRDAVNVVAYEDMAFGPDQK